MNRLPLALLAATLVLVPSVTHAATAIWIGPENGSWSDPANWSTGSPPSPADEVIIDDDPAQSTSVTVDSGAFAGALEINEGDKLSLGATTLLSWSTEIDGTLELAPVSTLSTSGLLHVRPAGRLELQPTSGLSSTSGPASDWWNQGTISGAGLVRPTYPFLNEGIIVGNLLGETLDISSFVTTPTTLLTNAGLIQAIDGGQLHLRTIGPHAIVGQIGEHARIEAGSNSRVYLEKIKLQGGTLAAVYDSSGNGTVDVFDSTLDSVTLEGPITATHAAIGGHISNTGTLHALTRLYVANEFVELTGGGALELGTPTLPAVLDFTSLGAPGRTILRNLDHTVRGRGTVSLNGAKLENRGIIEAGFGSDDPPLEPISELSLEGGSITNSGSIRATQNYALRLNNSDVTNSPTGPTGVIEAHSGGVLQIVSGSLTGGILRAVPLDVGASSPAGRIELSDKPKLIDVRVEGEVGSSMSEAELSGRFEIDGTLRLKNLYIRSDVEFVGGKVIVGPGLLRFDPTFPAPLTATITLTDTSLELQGIQNSPPNVYFNNHGDIKVPSGTMIGLQSSIVRNAGTIHAEAGSSLALGAIVPLDGTSGELRVDQSASVVVIRLSGVKVVSAQEDGSSSFGGTVKVMGNRSLSLPSLENITNHGHVIVSSGSIGGWIENNGVVELGSFDIDQFGPLLQLTGTGEVQLKGRQLLRPQSPIGVTLVNGPQHTIRTHGTLAYSSSTFVNQGIVQADTGTLNIQTTMSGSFVQQGTLRTLGSRSLNLSMSQNTFNNEGNIEISPAGSISISGPWQIVNREGATFFIDGTLNTYVASLQNDVGAAIRGNGTVLASAAQVTSPSILTNHGLVAPGSTVGDLQIRGNFVQSATGVLEIDVKGFDAGGFDQLIIETISSTSGGLATLAGTLDFNFAPELLPALGDELVVLTAKQIMGTFDTIEGLPTLAVGLDWQMDYLPTMVMATVIGLTPPNLAGDFNDDGFVDLADYTVWRDGLGDIHTASDYDLWKRNFGRSANDPSPEATTPASVPEPTAALLALAFLPLLARRANR